MSVTRGSAQVGGSITMGGDEGNPSNEEESSFDLPHVQHSGQSDDEDLDIRLVRKRKSASPPPAPAPRNIR
ncbi:hypothetical protein Hanom_Chr04g00384901 [Helianthus anomalus]